MGALDKHSGIIRVFAADNALTLRPICLKIEFIVAKNGYKRIFFKNIGFYIKMGNRLDTSKSLHWTDVLDILHDDETNFETFLRIFFTD